MLTRFLSRRVYEQCVGAAIKAFAVRVPVEVRDPTPPRPEPHLVAPNWMPDSAAVQWIGWFGLGQDEAGNWLKRRYIIDDGQGGGRPVRPEDYRFVEPEPVAHLAG